MYTISGQKYLAISHTNCAKICPFVKTNELNCKRREKSDSNLTHSNYPFSVKIDKSGTK